MKTSKSIKITSIIQGICCIIWLIMLLDLPSLTNMLPDGIIKNAIAIVGTVIFTAALVLPVGPVCLMVNLVSLFRARKKRGRRNPVGSNVVVMLIIFTLVSILWWTTFKAIIIRAGV